MKLNLFKIPKKYLLLAILMPFIYSAFVLCFVWWHCFTSPLQHGRNGPLDAYRHTLASAVVAYTSSPKVVRLVSLVMENKGTSTNVMDKHNNKIGAQIGAREQSLADINAAVTTQIMRGCIDATSPTQSTWLPQKYWGERLFW
jgi:hypothetical protein